MLVLKKSSWKKMFNIYVYERKSNIRKLFDDWGIHISLRHVTFLLLASSFLLFSTIFLISFYFKDSLNNNNLISLSLLLLLINLISHSLTFYNSNKAYFILDTRKSLFQNKEFRMLRLFSKFLEVSIRNTIIYWCLMFFPFYLGIVGNYSLRILCTLLIATFLYFAITLFTSLLFSFSFFMFSVFFRSLIISNMISFFLYLFTCILTFLLPYTILTTVLRQEGNIIKIQNIINGTFFQVNDYMIFNGNLLGPSAIVLIIVLLIGLSMLILWCYTLNKIDLLPYLNDKNNFKPNYKKTPFFKKRHPFFVKDYIYLTRLNEWWWEHLGRTFIVLSLISGISLPIIKIFLATSSPLYFVSVTGLLSMYLYQILGDSLRILLAIDQETKNMHLFINRKISLWEIVVEKLRIYNYFVLIATLIIVILSILLIKINLLNLLLIICISYSFGSLSGIIQISTTALFPKKNWEHFYEIGNSHKASYYNGTLNTILVIIYTLIPTILYFTEKHLKIPFEIMAASIIIFLILFSIMMYKIAKLYLLKVNLREVFFNND